MMTSSRPRDAGTNFSNPGRRGHSNQLSISDPSHHVTEAIGTMYGDDEEYSSSEGGRPLSFIASPYGGEQLDKQLQSQQKQQPQDSVDDRPKFSRSRTADASTVTVNTALHSNSVGGGLGINGRQKSQTMPSRIPSQRNGSLDGNKAPLSPISPLSPLSPSLRDVQADASQFPMSNMDNPNDIAQELSNLQALRRMSMDVGNNSDPDLLPFSSMSLMAMPSIAPTGDDDEADPSRLLWVPANVHPELEPTAFKNFLEKRVQSIKRRSGDSMLSVEGLQRNNSGSLRRKKSMLSRQIDNKEGEGYRDGSDRLERTSSLSDHPIPELSLDELVKDPTQAVRKLTQETTGGEGDMPILPVAPGVGLRRSTRTTYRKGGSLRGDKVPFSKRVAARNAEKDAEDKTTPAVPSLEDPARPLQRVQSEPAIAENYSRPTRSVRRQQGFTRDPMPTGSQEGVLSDSLAGMTVGESTGSLPSNNQFPPRSDSSPMIPQIVKTPPSEDSSRSFPARSSSQQSAKPMDQPPPDGPPARSAKRMMGRQTAPIAKQQLDNSDHAESNSLAEMANHPAALPGGGASRTDSLTFIPTFSTPEDKKAADRKSRDADSDSVTSSKSSSGWKWFKGEKDKKKREKEDEREREREEREENVRRSKGKDKDNARLDVLQNSIDNGTPKSSGRESLVMDRDSVEKGLLDERKKDGHRKSAESRKEKDGFFGGLFGGSKKKGDKDQHGKRKELRPATPEPPPRVLIPDVDYGWTRFPIVEERAIYRMAHLKLANPRRPLHSQVLLSNFMYSYLAKVQAMHPHIQVPISPQQKKQEEERRRREAEQQQQMEQQMAQQGAQDGNFNFEYHRSGGSQYGSSSPNDGSVQYMDQASMYAYQNGEDSHGAGGSGGGAGGGGYHGQGDNYQGRQHHEFYYDGNSEEDPEDDMW